MRKYLDRLPEFVDSIKSIQETIITNILFVGQTPSPTFQEKHRAQVVLDRLSESQVDECTTDGYRNPIGIVRGTAKNKPPIFVVAHLDTVIPKDVDHNYMVYENTIVGPGILDNSIGAGVLISLPEIIKRLGLRFKSDIVLAGVIQSMGKGNLRGIRHLLKTWPTPIRGGICIEGGELGRLNYNSDGMLRCEVDCNIDAGEKNTYRFRPNAILILNEVINHILQLRLPQKPRARVIIGKISGGFKHGLMADSGSLGFEIQSDTDKMVRSIFNDIKDIVSGTSHEHRVKLELHTISNLSASSLGYNHPLVKSAVAVMERLGLVPVSAPTETELSIFLSQKIPAVTMGLTHGEHYHKHNATIHIEPMFTGIAQIIGVLMAIDNGVCDG